MQEKPTDTMLKCFEYLLVLLQKYREQIVGRTHDLMLDYTSSVLCFEGRRKKDFSIHIGEARLNDIKVPEGLDTDPNYSVILRTNNRQLSVIERGKLGYYFHILEKESNQTI
jgi:hypothetical protein